MHRCKYSDYLTVENNKLCRVINAEYKYMSMNVYKDIEGDCYLRNIFYSGMGGYLVSFPGEINKNWYGQTEIQELNDWEKQKKIKAFNWYSRRPTETEKDIILSVYPDFKYVLKKWNGTIAEIIEVLPFWKEFKEVELLLANGFYKLASNKQFYKLTESKKKEVLSFLRKENIKDDILLCDMQARIKYNITQYELQKYKDFCIRYKKCAYGDYLYFLEQADKYGDDIIARVIYEYSDYKRMLKRTTHNSRDKYWKYPTNFVLAHTKIVKEIEEIEKLESIKQLKAKEQKYLEVVKSFLPLSKNINGYDIYIPGDVDDWNKQAKELHQCIVAMNYIDKVIEQKSVIVFIRKKDKPVATAEIKGKKIVQFYADELDRENCLPKKSVVNAMNKWLEMYKKNDKTIA